jgi:hypothetical protein
MERNRWETAIRCLEVALHPNTNDDEVIAAVNAFRRTANGTPLSDVCAEIAGGDDDDRRTAASPRGWRETLDRLSRENLDLRRKLESGETSRIAIVRRLHEAEQNVRDLSEDLASAQRRAGAAEQQLADFRSTCAVTIDGLNRENFDLRAALGRARVSAAQPPAAPPFSNFLAAARLGTADRAEAIITPRRPTPDSVRENGGLPISGPGAGRPWTA